MAQTQNKNMTFSYKEILITVIIVSSVSIFLDINTFIDKKQLLKEKQQLTAKQLKLAEDKAQLEFETAKHKIQIEIRKLNAKIKQRSKHGANTK